VSVSPTGIVSLPLYYAQQTLAASVTFQGLMQVSTSAAAAARVFIGETDENADGDARPRALLDHIDDIGFDKITTTGLLGNGTVECIIEVPTPAAYAGVVRDARIWFYNALGGVLSEMFALAGVGGYLNILGYKITAIGRADPKDNDGADFWVCDLDLNWQG
jgi:hypothetical protein